jgi:predicted RNA-binding protein YlxR (DUF448 family)
MLARLDHGDTDHGPRHAGSGTARRCVVTREVKSADEMIRFVVGPDGAVVPDLKRKLPGRGAWVTARRDCVAAAKRSAFARAFRGDVMVAPDLAGVVDARLERAVLDALAIAHKAGQVATGSVKVQSAVESGAAVAYLHASAAAPDGVRRIVAAGRRGHAPSGGNLVVIDAFTAAHLDLALGHPNVVHAALLAGRASDTMLARWRALAHFRMSDPGGSDAVES